MARRLRDIATHNPVVARPAPVPVAVTVANQEAVSVNLIDLLPPSLNENQRRELLALTYKEESTPILTLSRREVLIEVLNMIQRLGYASTIEFLRTCNNSSEVIWNQPSLAPVVDSQHREYDVLRAPTRGVKGIARCPRCHENEVYYSMEQLRSADEPMTVFYTCINCGNNWKT